MNAELIRQKKLQIVERYGRWTAHNIQLKDDIYTFDKNSFRGARNLQRIIQVISDGTGRPFQDLRILDLACLEGLFGIECARHGAQVVAIEGREANIEKARFAKDVLSLDNLELVLDDVRNLSSERYGYFDVILCLGILYHLNVPDVFVLMEKMAEVCKRLVIIDTHVSMAAEESYVYDGRKYWGSTIGEHSAKSTPQERANALWASLDNLTSFWLTRSSLYNLLSHVQFTSAYECRNPVALGKGYNRITVLAIKGRRKSLLSLPLVNDLPDEEWPEKPRYFNALVRLSGLLPGNVRDMIKRMVS